MSRGAFDLRAFHSALDGQRIAKGLTWKEVAEQSGVSASTLTRIAKGRRPDVDGLALLLVWLGVDFYPFVPEANVAEPLAQVSANLRADRNLSSDSARALDAIIKVAYEQFKGK